MNLPIAVSNLSSFLPHRGAAVWVDSVVAATEGGGTCEVTYKPEAHYARGDTFIPSAFVEWMAQSFGYVTAAQQKLGLLTGDGNLKQAFLAAIKNFEITSIPTKILPGQKIQIHVRASHVVGPITLVEGSAEFEGVVLAKAQLKLFAVPQT